MPKPDPLTFGSLFAGIGGFDLGFERAGMVCKWQVEIDPYCQRVLAKHWPDVRRHDDIKTFPPTDPEEWRVDVICGGFPCQDISVAGKGAGLRGERSGLFFEAVRVAALLRPRYLVLENVSALLGRGMGEVLGELAAIGYDAEWHCLPAAAFGAPILRDRAYLVAVANEVVGGARFRIQQPHDWKGPLSAEGYRERAKACGWNVEAAPRVGRVDDGLSDPLDAVCRDWQQGTS